MVASHPRQRRQSQGQALPPTPFLAFERTFLGLRAAPWRVRAAEAGFEPDQDGDYCPRCGGPVGFGEVVGEPPSCAACRDENLPWSQAVRLGAWAGPLRHAILEAKYARWRRLAFDLGCEFGRSLGRRLEAAGLDPAEVALVPVPMSFRRRWTRGIDHTLAIARGVRVVTGCTIVRPLRRRHRPPQASLPESGRESNVRGCFLPGIGGSVAGFGAVVVLDDVRTTGATLRAACRALAARERRLGTPLDQGKTWVATLAVVTPKDRRQAPEGEVPAREDAPQESPGGAGALII